MKHKFLFSLGLTSSILLLGSCQDEDFGYSQGEVHQSYLNRKYAEEFAKAFPNVDPNHTWMCAPDTFGVESLIEGAMTRAYDPSKQIVITSSGTSTTTEAEAEAILSTEKDSKGKFIGKLPEAQDNRGQVSQSFEYFAVKDYKDGYQEYTVTPMFWGRKFCDANQIGIYYIGNDNQKHDLDPFWDDQAKRNIYVRYTDRHEELVAITDQQINEDPNWSNYAQHVSLGHKCSVCGIDIIAKDKDKKNGWRENPKPNSGFAHKYIELTTEDSEEEWDTQLIITSNRPWNGGDDFVLELTYQVTGDVDLTEMYYEFQSTPGRTVCSRYTKPNVRREYTEEEGTNIISFEHGDEWAEWKTIKIYGKIPFKGDCDGTYKDEKIKTIAINLAKSPGTNYIYRFSNIKWYYKWDNDFNTKLHTDAGLPSSCTQGKYPIEYYKLPDYKIQVPVGMKWGFYLKTKKQQNDANNYGQIWYSNSKFNEVTDKDKNHGFVSAAATYQITDPSNPDRAITYCCFEDAACRLHEYEKDNKGNDIKQKYEGKTLIWNEGNCHCGYGHYDTDYNDIILRIVSDPVVVSSYKSLKYRVMCEDLGGTWDWDFNDIVYDVEYSDAENENDQNAKAKIQVKLQAVGGTLPVVMEFANSTDSKYHISSMSVDNNSTDGLTRDLHVVLSNQTPDNKTKLYLPVNVPEHGGQATIVNQTPKVVCTYTLNGRRFDDLDPCIFVDLIKIKVQQNPTSSSTTTTTVAFPTQYNGTSKTPECFMTSISTPWPNEHQKVSDRFPGFNLWVEGKANNEKWWSEGFGGGTTEVVTQ